MPTLLQRQADPARIIASLASECHVPVDEIAPLYTRACARLAVGARVSLYLPIFAAREVLAHVHALEQAREQALEQAREQPPAIPPC